jgi:alpha-tubulin suppressor-like RCC1 family protein
LLIVCILISLLLLTGGCVTQSPSVNNSSQPTISNQTPPLFIAISAGRNHNLALKSDGTVVAWGDNGHGQSDVPANLTNVVAISAGLFHSLALKSDGTVVAWGDNENNQCNVPANLSDVIAISAGGFQSLALKKDGTIIEWGGKIIYG